MGEVSLRVRRVMVGGSILRQLEVLLHHAGPRAAHKAVSQETLVSFLWEGSCSYCYSGLVCWGYPKKALVHMRRVATPLSPIEEPRELRAEDAFHPGSQRSGLVGVETDLGEPGGPVGDVVDADSDKGWGVGLHFVDTEVFDDAALGFKEDLGLCRTSACSFT